MSRLDAALQRAATGVAVKRAPVEPPARRTVQPEPELAVFDRDLDQAMEPSWEQPPSSTTPDVFDPLSTELDERRFRSFNVKHAEKLVVSSSMPEPLREHYRRLGATLHHAQAESGLKTLMITSAVPDEGKTLTATNIALTLSESYQRRVLLIDADLRRPSLDDVFQVPKGFGLNEALTSNPPRKVSLIQVSHHLSLLTAGAPDPDPMSTLTGERMRQLLAEAAASFEWVIIDTPPVGILTDAKLLGSMVDAALVVIRAGKTPSALIQRAVDSLGRNRIMGVVLNRVEPVHAGGSYSYYNSYYYSSKKKR